ncbi:MAG: tRNA (adenosine(37)-N6)-dimethylallyltransferase MiaA [Rhodanobacteraceae bacterium]
MHRPDPRPVSIFLMGPTASGKTALACQLADRFGLNLVSVDSALVYRGMDIGTAKPDAATLARYPHALVDLREPSASYSAAEFVDDARAEMKRITDAGAVPLLVGGTSLYFRALQYGLSPLPSADPDIRARLSREAHDAGWPALHARLQKLDPDSAARIKPGDSQRIQRALEVIELSGQPLSDQLSGPRPRFDYRVLKLALVPERALLHQRIAERFDLMLEAGFLDEVRALRQRGDLNPDMPAMRAVGYRQAWQHLDTDTNAEQFRDAALAATRQLAKRQTTWLRSTLDARWLQTGSATEIATRAVADFLR